MKILVNPILVLLIILLIGCRPDMQATQQLSAVDHVDPLIGTARAATPSALKHSVSGSELRGQTFPGVGMPHGMTQWTPQTQYSEKKCLPPYYFEEDSENPR
ncbi:MAG: hypothetical protein U5K79_23680 [Cyclobacteriaceae bacterium]|nr:hypothetical protein [Cyclobacteriaceae bacterium]